MAYATLEVLAGRVRDDLQRHFGKRRSLLNGALRDLLGLLLTARVGGALEELSASGEVRGLWTHARALEAYLRDESHLPEAICARYKYKTSEAKALHRYKVSRRTWDYFHDLAKELGWKADLQVPLIAYEQHPWHDDLEERFVNVEAVLDTRALEGMLIYAMEAYLSPRKGRRKFCEIYGISLGMTRDVYHKKPRDGMSITRYVSVMRSHPQLSAEAYTTYVVPNTRSLQAILAATATLYPQYQAVGDFHSHPYEEFSRLEARKGWQFSDTDEAANVDLAQSMVQLGHHLLVTFVIAIAQSAQKVTSSHYRGWKNTIQVSLGRCRVIVAAYRSLGSGRLTHRNIRLALSGVTG